MAPNGSDETESDMEAEAAAAAAASSSDTDSDSVGDRAAVKHEVSQYQDRYTESSDEGESSDPWTSRRNYKGKHVIAESSDSEWVQPSTEEEETEAEDTDRSVIEKSEDDGRRWRLKERRDDDLDAIEEEEEEEDGGEMDDEAGEEEVDELEEDTVDDSDLTEAKRVMQVIRYNVSAWEQRAILKGGRPTGPPIQAPLSGIDELSRKFRWPVRLETLRNTEFSQDASEIIEDYEIPVAVPPKSDQDSDDHELQNTSAFAAPPRPLMTSTALALSRISKKRKRTANRNDHQSDDEITGEREISSAAFINLARAGNQFGDRLVNSLLSTNLRALQGLDEGAEYSQHCWTPLPVSRRPTANWRFVLEHVLKHQNPKFGESTDNFLPRMKSSTLQRIRDRLKNLYGPAWRREDDANFNHINDQEQQQNATEYPSHEDAQTIQL